MVSLSELYTFLSKYTARSAPAAITGGGGKTSLLYGLGAELKNGGGRCSRLRRKFSVRRPRNAATSSSAPRGSAANFCARAPERAKLAAASGESGGKLIGYAPAEIDALAAHGAADFVIAECDGSRGRSLKFYEEWEPPVPETSAAVFAVLGADAFGCAPSEDCIFRAAQFLALHGAYGDAPLKAETILKYLLCAEGPLKTRRARRRRYS